MRCAGDVLSQRFSFGGGLPFGAAGRRCSNAGRFCNPGRATPGAPYPCNPGRATPGAPGCTPCAASPVAAVVRAGLAGSANPDAAAAASLDAAEALLPLLRQAVLPLQAGLTRRVVAQIIVSRRIGLPQRALLGDDLSPDALGGMDLAHDALIALRLLRRNHQRCRGKRPPAPGRIVKPLAPCVSEPSRAPLRSLTSICPTLPSGSG